MGWLPGRAITPTADSSIEFTPGLLQGLPQFLFYRVTIIIRPVGVHAICLVITGDHPPAGLLQDVRGLSERTVN